MKILLLLEFSLLGLLACRQAPPPPVSLDRDAVVTEVKTMFTNYFRDIKESGLTAEFSYLDASDDFFWVPPGYTSALSYDSVRTILEDNAGAFQRINYQWDNVRVNPLSPELAAYSGVISGSMLDTAGNVTQLHMTESGVVIRRLDGWKILCGQSAHLPVDEK